LPNDLVMVEQRRTKNDSHTDYSRDLKKRLTRAYECCREMLESSHRTQKHYYDRRVRGNVYKEGVS
jgi:hypothetical protein